MERGAVGTIGGDLAAHADLLSSRVDQRNLATVVGGRWIRRELEGNVDVRGGFGVARARTRASSQ